MEKGSDLSTFAQVSQIEKYLDMVQSAQKRTKSSKKQHWNSGLFISFYLLYSK